jgi:hypothetical protein
MIPKYVFDTKQTCLNVKNVSIKDKLMNYRKFLYSELLISLKKPFAQKFILINDYKIKIMEIDNAINREKRKFTILK